ncbi:MAG: hypothetical protein ACPG9Q_00580 [Candidatus Thalassarchaeaceae archaeon]
MSTRIEHTRTLAMTIALLFLGMSLSMGLQQHGREVLEEEPVSMETHSGLNMPGSTVGSIHSLTALGASNGYTCAVLDNNEMKCWGKAENGSLGNGDGQQNQYTPVGVNELNENNCCFADIEETSPDGDHSCALSNGSVYCWGLDTAGQIGHGHISCFGACLNPHGPSVLNRNVVTFTTGLRHTCAIADDSTTWCWGENDFGQLGVGDNDGRNAPAQVLLPAGATPISINAGGHTTCVVLDNGTGLCWGKSDYGHLGDGTYNNRNEPTPISILPSNRSLVAMDLGAGHACGILDDGTAHCWGNNTFSSGESGGRLGDGSTQSSRFPRSVSLPLGKTAISIDVGVDHTCAILDDSSAACWGLNEEGQLGDGTTDNSTTPVGVSVPVGLTFGEISAGLAHTCAVATNASVYCWGHHEEGALGLGEDVDSDVPAYVDLGTGRHALMSERDNDDDGIVNILDPFPDGCPSGYYATNGTCELVEPGHYTNDLPPYEQFPCQPGTYQPSYGQLDCIDASAGNYVESPASVSQTPCGAGSYQPDSGQTSCVETDPGNYVSDQGSIRQNQCSPGTYQPSPAASGCIDASPGYYVTGFASEEQIPCTAGTYQILSGQASCFQAGPGFHVPSEGSVTQQQCQPGTFSSQQGQVICTEASPGYFADGVQQSSQSPCQPGEFQNSSGETSCLSTTPGHYTDSEGAAEQTQCPAGTYQPDSGQTTCISAEPGYYSEIGALSQIQCQNGTYSSESGQGSCTPAEPGFYVDLDGATGSTPCPPGQFQSDTGSSGCELPPPGQIASPDGSTTVSCPPGKYQPGDQSICVDASPGFFVNETGSSTQSQCPPGTYQPDSGESSCLPANPGNYVDSPGSSSQTPCPTGQFQSFGGQESCTPAMEGHHVPEQGAVSQTTCKPGNYQPDQGMDNCISADPGNFVSSSGAISQSPCQPGNYQPEGGKVGCLPADPGNYVSEAASTEQRKCPSGQEQELGGQVSCIDVERPLWMSILMFGVPAILLGTMAILYISNKKSTGSSGKGKAYMYSEDIRKKQP